MQIQPFDRSTQFPALVRAMHELEQHYFGDQAPPPASLALSLQQGLLGPQSGVQILVALDGEEIAALATYSLLYPAPQERGQLFMKDLFVRRQWRSQGLGERLMRHLAAEALRANCLRFDWTAETNNPGAMAFYQALGAKPVTEKVYYRLTGEALQALAAEPAPQATLLMGRQRAEDL